MTRSTLRFPDIVVSPQCPKKSFWSNDDQQERLLELLAHVRKQYNVNEDRAYLTGLSMGGKKIRLTTLEYVGHLSWQAAYESNDLYDWFDKQKASQDK